MRKGPPRKPLAAACALWAVVVGGCGAIPDYRTLVEVDLHPPQLIGIRAVAPQVLTIEFDEAVRVVRDSAVVVPPLAISTVDGQGSELRFTFGDRQQVGVAYSVEVSVEDLHRNSSTVMTQFYGFNPRLPRLLINEFTSQGSSTHPDLVELVALSEGDTAGMCLYEGTASNHDERKVLPSIAVEPGDFIVVHFKPQGLPEEGDETDATATSGGLDASPAAYDLWVTGGNGLSGNNGVLALYDCPGGRLIDAVVYSNRTSKSDADYAGFGSKKVHERVLEVEAAGGWEFAGDHVTPEEVVNPDPSTATRSVSRDSRATDSNRSSDWHITPTSGATFGAPNGDEVYVPR